MLHNQTMPALLVLADGTVFRGCALGAKGTTGGELCFNTGMTGYQEIFTDPSYFGQIVVSTVSHIGNYGVMPEETESDQVQIRGLICKEFSRHFSRLTAQGSLQQYLERAGVVGICEIDSRQLVRHIRQKGAMNAMISSEILDEQVLLERVAQLPDMAGLELSSAVTTRSTYALKPEQPRLKVAVLDLGVKRNILESLTSRGCEVKVFPAGTSYMEMKAWEPNGYFISNGPGDPAATVDAVQSVRQMLEEDKPLFGICLGHQVLALANDIPTYKMHHGHRGLNHPVKNLLTGRCEITSQNHGFAVDAEAAGRNPNVEITHLNLNDNTVEGMRLKHKRAFSVQYHPESSPGPHDSEYLFDDFVKLMEQG